MKKHSRLSRATRLKQSLLALHEAIVLDHHRLMSVPGVRGVAVGLKEVRGKLTRRVCVKIYVAEKQSISKLRHKPFPKTTKILLPAGKGLYKTRRVPTDVVELKGFRYVQGGANYFQQIPSGAQVGLGGGGQMGPGTQACIVRRRTDGKLFLLTAAHVLVTQPGTVPPGIQVYQPDVTGQNFNVGPTVVGYRGNHPDVGAYLDVAIYAKANASRTAVNATWDQRIPRLNGSIPLAQACQAQVSVHKVGATSGYTTGLFSAFYANLSDPQLGSFLNVLEFVVDSNSPGGVLADSGDSGAAVVSRSSDSFGAIVGILFAASPDGQRALVVPFEFIQQCFGIDVA